MSREHPKTLAQGRKPGRYLTPTDKAAVRAMLASGMSHIAAAAVIGCTRQAIDHFAKLNPIA